MRLVWDERGWGEEARVQFYISGWARIRARECKMTGPSLNFHTHLTHGDLVKMLTLTQ